MSAAKISADIAGLAVPLDRLDMLEGNPRNGDVDAVMRSYTRFGQRKPITARPTADGRGEVTAGNHQLMAAQRLGWDSIAVVWEADDDMTAKAWALADNRTADLGSYDRIKLAEMVGLVAADPELLAASSYSADDLALLKESVPADDVLEGDEPSEAPGPAPAHTRPGDVWLLGGQRLACGDCRDPAVVAGLLAGARVNLAVTSPPYADRRKYDPESGFEPIPPESYVDWFEPVAANVAEHLADDGSWLVNIKAGAEPDGLDTSLYVLDLVSAHVRRWGWHFATEFCWERPGVPGHARWRLKNAFEPIYQFTRDRWKFRSDNVRHRTDRAIAPKGPGGGGRSWVEQHGEGGDRMFSSQRVKQHRPNEARQGDPTDEWFRNQYIDGDGWAFPSNRLPTFAGTHTATGHAAAFPVGLPAFLIRLFTDPGDTVLDPFVGSGSTLLAAHEHGRAGYGIELSAPTCDLAARRFQEATDIVPVRASTGEPVSFLG
jgi:site-specific DNA-methyltransferase (adenine-specific)